MKLGCETVALPNNSFAVRGYGGFANMLAGTMVPPMLLPPTQMQQPTSNIYSASQVPLLLEGRRDVTFSDGADNLAPHEPLQPPSKAKEEESESKSSSDNGLEGASGEDHEEANPRPSKKRYHRHTLHQIQEMERFFKECPHPDEKLRQELSRELNLSSRQIKFWFQNKRTQMKAHQERQDNSVLRAANEKLKAENFALRDAIRNLACPNCGGPAILADMSFDEQQLRIENAGLREEIERITALAGKYTGCRQFPMLSPLPLDEIPAPCFPRIEPVLADTTSKTLMLMDDEKAVVVDIAVRAMEEFLQVSQAGDLLWVSDSAVGKETMDLQVYMQRFPQGLCSLPALKSETSRCAGHVTMDSASLVETLMEVNRWMEMFPSIISGAQVLGVLSTGVAGSYDGAIQLIFAEFQVPTPLIPTREYYLLRYAKRVGHLWAVVDVSIDSLQGNTPLHLRCRRRPSGCLIEEMPGICSKVLWVEHAEADNTGVHELYLPFVTSGMAFGAHRWLSVLQRQCESTACLLASNISVRNNGDFGRAVMLNIEGRRSMLKLAERMTGNFCGGVSASTVHTWVTLAGNGSDDVRVVIRKSIDDPGRPSGIVLSAATSLWLPVSPSRVFKVLRDEHFRTEWDILSNSGVVESVVHVPKGQDPGNSVSLLRVDSLGSDSNMFILQECCADESCSLIVYAPVDAAAMSAVLNGGDTDCVALLPSGFAIFPAVHYKHASSRSRSRSSSISTSASSVGLEDSVGGTLLTVAFQIVVDNIPTARLSLSSVATVNKLISETVTRIKGALA